MMATPFSPEPECYDEAHINAIIKRRQARFEDAMNHAGFDKSEPAEVVIIEKIDELTKSKSDSDDDRADMLWVVLVAVIALIFSWGGIR